jgi:acyl carrier protein
MRERIKEVVKRTFELTGVDDDISMTNCDKWDSLNHLNLMIELESEFNISIEPEDIAVMRSLGEIEQILHKLTDYKS